MITSKNNQQTQGVFNTLLKDLLKATEAEKAASETLEFYRQIQELGDKSLLKELFEGSTFEEFEEAFGVATKTANRHKTALKEWAKNFSNELKGWSEGLI